MKGTTTLSDEEKEKLKGRVEANLDKFEGVWNIELTMNFTMKK